LVTIPWSRLRGIGNSAAAKSTILIPLVGYLFLFNEQIIEALKLHSALEMATAPHASGAELGWRLLCLYYGLTFVAIATIVYALSCPQVCKRYADSVEYSRDVLEIHSSPGAFRGLVGELGLELEAASGAPTGVRNAADGELKLLDSGDAAATWGLLPSGERPSRLLRLLAAKYNLMDYTRPAARRATAVLYATGLVLLAIPAMQLFYRVTLTLLE